MVQPVKCIGLWSVGLYDASTEVKTQVFEPIDLCDKLATYGNVAHTVLQHILGFTYIDLEPIFLSEEIH